MNQAPAFAAFLVLAGCAAPPQTFTPGVEGRSAQDVCGSTTAECQRWTELARKCEENMHRREEGYMGPLEPFCEQMEQYREQVTGIPLSSSPGAYDF